MKILLINPPAMRIRESLHDTPAYPHLGLGYLAGMLKKNDMVVEVIDARLQRLSFTEVYRRACDFSPDLTGITSRTCDIETAARLAAVLRRKMPHAPVVLGGPQATGAPAETLRQYTSFSAAVCGEGELTFLELAEALQNDGDISHISGIYRRENGQIIANTPREHLDNLDDLPFPAWELFPGAGKYYIIASRGCPYKCVNCMRLFGSRVRRRSPENIVAELEKLVCMGARDIEFADESFTIDNVYVKQVCDLILKNNLNRKIRWCAQTRVDLVNSDMLSLMREAGCYMLCVGAESGSQKILRAAHKDISPNDTFNAVNMIRNAGIVPDVNFMLGLPGETRKTACDTLRFLWRLNPELFSISIAVPYPGTRLRSMAQRGIGGLKLISDAPADYNNQIGGAMELDGFSRRSLELFQLCGYLGTFLINFRFKDFIGFVYRYRREGVEFLVNWLFRSYRLFRNEGFNVPDDSVCR